jgi:hypothetical protein
MSKYYDKRSSKARKLRLTEEMQELVPEISKCIEGKKALLYNGEAKPFEAPYTDDPIETCKALKQVLINKLGCAESIARMERVKGMRRGTYMGKMTVILLMKLSVRGV